MNAILKNTSRKNHIKERFSIRPYVRSICYMVLRSQVGFISRCCPSGSGTERAIEASDAGLGQRRPGAPPPSLPLKIIKLLRKTSPFLPAHNVGNTNK